MTLRCVHIIPAITEEASGPSYSVVRLCEELIAQGQKTRLAALDWASMDSLPPFLKPFLMGIGPRRLGASPAMRRWLFSQAMAHSVDVIHNHSLWMMPNVYAGRVAKQWDIPLVVSPRGTLSVTAMQFGTAMKRVFWPIVQRPALSATACFHATADSEYEDIRRMGFHQPVAVIPNGVDVPERVPKTKSDSRTLLFLSRIHPKKGLDILLPAWRAVQDRFADWRLRIVGPGKKAYFDQVNRLASELHLNRVEFVGPLYGKEKTVAYGQADLFVLPTYSENFGMSVAEALAAGTPVIVTKGAPWGKMETVDCGWWIDIGVDALVACLEDALSRSEDELNEMGLRGRRWMEAEFSWSQVARKMVKTYQWILDRQTKVEWVKQS